MSYYISAFNTRDRAIYCTHHKFNNQEISTASEDPPFNFDKVAEIEMVTDVDLPYRKEEHNDLEDVCKDWDKQAAQSDSQLRSDLNKSRFETFITET